MLCHPGETQTEHTLRQHFDWKVLHTTVPDVCKKCPTCQRAKTTNQKYGKLPPKQAENNHWDTMCVDLIGPYTIPKNGKNLLKLWCLTMINPATVWFGMAQIHNKTAAEISDITKKNWFTRYPLPQRIVFDRGTKFMAGFSKMCKNNYSLKSKPITTRNPQSNAIIKRVYQAIGNIIRTFDVSNIFNNDTWSDILAATMFAVREIFHRTLKAYPMQLVFGRDAILNIKHVAHWVHIRQRKQLQINHNNGRINMRRNNHQYKVGDKIIVKHNKNSKHEL